jgi:hypothetical protein
MVITQLDEESVLPNISRDTLELKGLKSSPSEQGSVSGGKFSERFGEIFVSISVSSGIY